MIANDYIEFIKFLKTYADTNRINGTFDKNFLLLISGDEDRVHGKFVAHPKQ